MIYLLLTLGFAFAQEEAREMIPTVCSANTRGGKVVVRLNGQANATALTLSYRGKTEAFAIVEGGKLVDKNGNFLEYFPTVRLAGDDERRFARVSWYSAQINLYNMQELSGGYIPCKAKNLFSYEELRRAHPPRVERVPRASVDHSN